MYEKVRRLYESGEIERWLAYCQVEREDWPDLMQDVAVRLLSAKKEKIRSWESYVIGVIRNEYWGSRGRWAQERRRKKVTVELSEARGEVYDP